MGYGPLIKYGLMILAFLGFCAGLILYGSHRKQLEWDAAIAAQAIQAAENVIAAAENTARIETQFQRKLHAHAERVRVVKKEVKVYVEGPSKKCMFTPEFVRAFDGISRLYDPTPDGLPAAADAPGESVGESDATITDAEALSAYEHAVVQLFANYQRDTELISWVRSSYAIARKGAGREDH